MELFHIEQSDPFYPSEISNFLCENAPKSLTTIGNPNILKHKKLVLLSSAKCPGNLILKTHDFVHHLLKNDIAIMSGFHSPVEKECLRILLRGKKPIIICPARSLSKMRIPSEWRTPVNERRLLLISPFEGKFRRIDKKLATLRNKFVAALADEVFISHASKGSKTIEFVQELVNWGKPVLTFNCEENEYLLEIGVKPLRYNY